MLTEIKSNFLKSKLKQHSKIPFVYYCDAGLLCIHHLNKSFMNKVYFDYTPKNLLAQMWINLAKFAVGETKFKQCEYSKCKNWFEIPTSKSGNPQRFCSNSHRVMSYRK